MNRLARDAAIAVGVACACWLVELAWLLAPWRKQT